MVSRGADGKLNAESTWTAETHSIAKVNAMIVNEQWLCIGGIDKAGKGIVEVWTIAAVNERAEALNVVN